jgi:peptide/nickel transport system substrate-binding protein
LAIHNTDFYGDQANPFDINVMDTTGFFRVTKFEPREMMGVERFEGYWGKRPQVDQILFKRIADPQSLLIEALSGKPHIVRSIPSEGASLIEKSEDMNLVEINNPGITSLYFNTRLPQLEDVRVRRALGWGIDRQEIIDLGYAGIGIPTPSWYASNAAYPEAKEMGFTHYDPERASQLLDEAGWLIDESGVRKKNGQPLQLKFITYGGHKAALETIQSQLKKIGVVVEMQYSKDWGFVISQIQEAKWAAALINEESFSLSDLWRHFAAEGDLNYSHFDDKIMNQLIDRIAHSFDAEQRHNLILEANDRVFETGPIIPVRGPIILMAINKDVKGYIPHYFRYWEYMVTPDLDIIE